MSKTHTITTTCDRCDATIAEHPHLDQPSEVVVPAVAVLLGGELDTEFEDLCAKCSKRVHNLAALIALKKDDDPADDDDGSPPNEPADPPESDAS